MRFDAVVRDARVQLRAPRRPEEATKRRRGAERRGITGRDEEPGAAIPTLWMAHCHIAEHHESGMMFSFHVDE